MPTSRTVVGVIAVVGRDTAHDLLARVAEVDTDRLEVALRAAIDAQLVVVDHDTDAYRFRHALIGEVVYDELLPPERKRLHRRVADALADQPPDVLARRRSTRASWRFISTGQAITPAAFAALLVRRGRRRDRGARGRLAPSRACARALGLRRRVERGGESRRPSLAGRRARERRGRQRARPRSSPAKPSATELRRAARRGGTNGSAATSGAPGTSRRARRSSRPPAALLPDDAGPEAARGVRRARPGRAHARPLRRRRSASAAACSSCSPGPTAIRWRGRWRDGCSASLSTTGETPTAASSCAARRSPRRRTPRRGCSPCSTSASPSSMPAATRRPSTRCSTPPPRRDSTGLDRSFGGYLDALAAEGLLRLGRWSEADTVLDRQRRRRGLSARSDPRSRWPARMLAARRGDARPRACAARRGRGAARRSLPSVVRRPSAPQRCTSPSASGPRPRRSPSGPWPTGATALWQARFVMYGVVAEVELALDARARREPFDADATAARLRAADRRRPRRGAGWPGRRRGARHRSPPRPRRLPRSLASATPIPTPGPKPRAGGRDLADPYWLATARVREAEAAAAAGATARAAEALRDAHRLAAGSARDPCWRTSRPCRGGPGSASKPPVAVALGRRRDRSASASRHERPKSCPSSPPGQTNRQIGEALFVSEKTASVHVSNILRKLGCQQPSRRRRGRPTPRRRLNAPRQRAI